MSQAGSIEATPLTLPAASSRTWANLCLGAGLCLLIISGLCAIGRPLQAAYSWLFAFLYFFTLAAGSLFWSVLHHAVHAAWTTVFRRLWENVADGLRILAFLFLPILFFSPTIYHWMQADVIAHDPSLHEKDGYLNVAFFAARAVIFFAVFISIAAFYRRQSVAQDHDGSPAHSARLQERSFVLLALYGLSLTFASFDWIMSLDFHWSSTMFGVIIFSGASASSVALIIVLSLLLQRFGFLRVANVEHFHLLGKLLFSFVTFWGWVNIGQYLLMWYANIPEETFFFIDRNRGTWSIISISLIVLNFFLPFLILLPQATKRSPFWLGLTAVSVLIGHALELFWLVMPVIHPEAFAVHWLDLLIWLGMGLVLTWAFLRRVGEDALYPVRDPRLPEALEVFN